MAWLICPVPSLVTGSRNRGSGEPELGEWEDILGHGDRISTFWERDLNLVIEVSVRGHLNRAYEFLCGGVEDLGAENGLGSSSREEDATIWVDLDHSGRVMVALREGGNIHAIHGVKVGSPESSALLHWEVAENADMIC